jgi:hypothetical protein
MYARTRFLLVTKQEGEPRVLIMGVIAMLCHHLVLVADYHPLREFSRDPTCMLYLKYIYIVKKFKDENLIKIIERFIFIIINTNK